MLVLVAFAGLPGTGKTTIARRVAVAQAATYIRIDTIEQAMRSALDLGSDVGPAGYVVAYAVAKTNLMIGRIVVADSVNPVAAMREGWRTVAAEAGAPILQVEIICSDLTEHRRRVEIRQSDIPGLTLPTWSSVAAREYEPWTEPRLVVDTAGLTPAEAVALIGAAIDEIGHRA